MALLPTESGITSASTTNAQQKLNFAAIRNFLADLLGTDSADKAAARTALGAGIAGASVFTSASRSDAQKAIGAAIGPRVSGLRGNVNAATPLTKFDLAADMVIMRNADGSTETRDSTGTLTCDLGLAGSAPNGRDQAAAFPANSWIYLYFIWNGTTLATLASTTAPASFTGSTLPSGYTHWAFATAIRWNASSNIIPVYARGAQVMYQSISDGEIVSGLSTTMQTSLSVASFVPPNAQSYVTRCRTTTTAAGSRSTQIRIASGINFEIFFVEGGGSATNHATLPNVGQAFYALVSEAGTTTADLTVSSYRVANGDI